MAGRPLSTTILVILLILVGPAYLARRHIGRSATTWHIRDWTILTAAVALIAAAAITVITPASRGPVLHKFLGWPDNSVTIDLTEAIGVRTSEPAGQPAASTSPQPRAQRSGDPDDLRLEAFNGVLAVVKNKSDEELLVTKIRVRLQVSENFACRFPGPDYRYTLEGNAGVASGDIRKIEGFAQEDSAPDPGAALRTFPLSGSISGSRCLQDPTVDATLSVAMNLAANSSTSVEVLLGRTIFDAICSEPESSWGCPYSIDPGSPQMSITLADGTTIHEAATAR